MYQTQMKKAPTGNPSSRTPSATRPSTFANHRGSEKSNVQEVKHGKSHRFTTMPVPPKTAPHTNMAKSTSKTKGRPSDCLNPKTVDPFSTVKPKSRFESAYQNGSIPCRLVHGSVKHKLHWETQPEKLHFDPLLITLAEGLSESKHPLTFIAREGLKELLMTEDAEEKTIPLVPAIVPPIKTALSSTNGDIFERGLDALVQLSNVTGSVLNGHLKTLLPQLSRKLMDKRYKEKVTSCLQQLEYNGGKESLSQIKARVPTYQSIYG